MKIVRFPERLQRERRKFLQTTGTLGMWPLFGSFAPALAQAVEQPRAELHVREGRPGHLVIDRTPFEVGGRKGVAVTMNGTVPGPLLRLKEGETITLHVTNRLPEVTSVHWHGLLVPSDMDGVPGVSFPGIRPGTTFTYRYRVRQSGTYWYHSHSGFQEQKGHYAPMIIDPAGPDPVVYDRQYVVFLSDWTFEDPHRIFAKLKKQSDYYNFQQRTVQTFFADVEKYGWRPTIADRRMWGQMRMSPTDILDITGHTYTYLVNGLAPENNWTALFKPGERVRLRFINGSASTFFNVRIPGLPLTVVQADGQNVQPVTVDEFQIAVAETYDVIVQPESDAAYTIFVESLDRSGYTRGTLAPRVGMSAAVPPLRERPLRGMVDMGMDMSKMDMPGMDHGGGEMDSMPGMDHGGGKMDAMSGMGSGSGKMESMPGMEHGGGKMDPMPGMGHGSDKMDSMPGMDHSTGKSESMPGIDHEGMAMPGMEKAGPIVARHGPDTHGPSNTSVADVQRNRLGEPGTGLENVGHRVLVYNDLKSLEPNKDNRPPEREIEIHLTGNMEQFIWGMDGKKFSEAEPIFVKHGERVRITMVNDTMMEHPMHLHGVFMEIDNGAGPHKPRKHTINVKPAERLSFDFTYDEPGNFAFHCHLLFHMEAGMFRFLNVSMPADKVRS